MGAASGEKPSQDSLNQGNLDENDKRSFVFQYWKNDAEYQQADCIGCQVQKTAMQKRRGYDPHAALQISRDQTILLKRENKRDKMNNYSRCIFIRMAAYL